jgi:hypothetical protein
MTIDSNTGLISWTPNYAQGRTSAYTVTVAAANCLREAQTTYYLVVSDVQFEVPPEKPVYKPTPTPKPIPKCENTCGCGNTTTTTTTTTSCGGCGNGSVINNSNNTSNSNLNLSGLNVGQFSGGLVSLLVSLVSIVLALIFNPSVLILIILILIYRNWKNRKKDDLRL